MIQAWIQPGKQLVEILPPITPGLFLLNTAMIVFLRPRSLIRFAVLLWGVMAVPILSYLIAHPGELQTPRGLELLLTLGPAMGVNLALIIFYVRLQAAVDHLQNEGMRLQKISEMDLLTQVWNRRAGERILGELIEQKQLGLGIILCDIDHFKSVNDTYGHLVGDQVLQMFAQWCRQHVRPQDMVVRWGGEEFVVIGCTDEPAEMASLAARLCQGIAQQSVPEVGKITASFGVACHQPEETLSALFERADMALYQAKQQGRNRVVVKV
ncbi:GGDEF domain-containing protein [Gloeomargarita lithophora]|uniref:GGDEF domain-containing protein n=1 Tax=Gloeomargarita lithophora TaxID=1188228 RepID=UPI001C12A6F0|nr:GGDEF domain-containing protein [Gloeomargarita lithophora]